MQGDHVFASLDRGELALDLVALGLEPVHHRRQRRRIDAVLDDGIGCPVQFAVDLALAFFEFAALVAGVARKSLALLVIGLDVLDEIDRLGQFARKAIEGEALDILALHLAPVGAPAAFAKCRALQASRSLLVAGGRHAAAAVSAAEQAGKHATALVRTRRMLAVRLGPVRDLPRLCGPPKIIADDPQLRRLGNAPLIRRVRARDALFRRRVFDHANLIPHDPADIYFVQQQPMPALHIAVDRRGVPARASRRGDRGVVEIVRDVAWRFAGDVFGKDAPHDLGLGLDDLQLAGLAGNGAVAVRAAAGVATIPNDALHAAPGMHDEVFDEHLAHEGAQRPA